MSMKTGTSGRVREGDSGQAIGKARSQKRENEPVRPGTRRLLQKASHFLGRQKRKQWLASSGEWLANVPSKDFTAAIMESFFALFAEDFYYNATRAAAFDIEEEHGLAGVHVETTVGDRNYDLVLE